MIFSISLNPAIDKTVFLESLVPGQVNRLKRVCRIPGGKAVNVARILRQMGQDVMVGGFLGGAGGAVIREALRKEGIGDVCITTEGETRVNTNVVAEGGEVTEILEPGPVITPEELETFLHSYKEQLPKVELIVLSGSLPARVPEDIYAILIREAKEAGVPVLLDSSKEALKKGIEARPFMIKPNRAELEALLGVHQGEGEKWVIREAKKLHESGIPLVMVSLGAQGLISVSAEGVYRVTSPQVSAVNTVGCGDSLVAAAADALCREKQLGGKMGSAMGELLSWGAAVSAANATTAESGSVPLEVAEELRNRVKIEKVMD